MLSIWTFFKGKLTLIIGLIAGVFWMMFKHEKKERKKAEFEAKTEKLNREALEKKAKVIQDIDEEREAWEKDQESKKRDTIKKLEDLKDAKISTRKFIDNLVRLSNSDNQDKTD